MNTEQGSHLAIPPSLNCRLQGIAHVHWQTCFLRSQPIFPWPSTVWSEHLRARFGSFRMISSSCSRGQGRKRALSDAAHRSRPMTKPEPAARRPKGCPCPQWALGHLRRPLPLAMRRIALSSSHLLLHKVHDIARERPGRAQGARRSIRHEPSSVLLYRSRSCRRFCRPCQNSKLCGATR